jgi:hypothetical protein
MKRLHQLVMAIAVLIALPLPLPSAMLCFLTGSLAGQACCKHMQVSCGSESKPASAGCCESKKINTNLPAVSPRPISFDQIASSAIVIPLLAANHLQKISRPPTLSYPPGLDPDGGTHLRI